MSLFSLRVVGMILWWTAMYCVSPMHGGEREPPPLPNFSDCSFLKENRRWAKHSVSYRHVPWSTCTSFSWKASTDYCGSSNSSSWLDPQSQVIIPAIAHRRGNLALHSGRSGICFVCSEQYKTENASDNPRVCETQWENILSGSPFIPTESWMSGHLEALQLICPQMHLRLFIRPFKKRTPGSVFLSWS